MLHVAAVPISISVVLRACGGSESANPGHRASMRSEFPQYTFSQFPQVLIYNPTQVGMKDNS